MFFFVLYIVQIKQYLFLMFDSKFQRPPAASNISHRPSALWYTIYSICPFSKMNIIHFPLMFAGVLQLPRLLHPLPDPPRLRDLHQAPGRLLRPHPQRGDGGRRLRAQPERDRAQHGPGLPRLRLHPAGAGQLLRLPAAERGLRHRRDQQEAGYVRDARDQGKGCFEF